MAGSNERIPTLKDFFLTADRLAELVREAFKRPGSVKRPDLLRALEAYEKVRRDSEWSPKR